MNKKIENAKRILLKEDRFYDDDTEIKATKVLLEYIKELEQKKSILDKVTDKLKEDIENVNNNIKHISENDILTTIAREIAIGMKDYAEEILNIIEGEKK